MIKIKEREKIIISAVVTIILLILFIFLVLLPLSDKVKILKSQIKQSELTLKEALVLQAKKDYILFECNKFSEHLQYSEASDQENEGWLLKEIEKLSQKSYLAVVNLGKSEIEQDKNFKIYNADLKAEGEISQILKFFSYVEESTKLLIVKDFVVAPKDDKATSLELDATISMYVPQIVLPDKK
jgi:Tfp pilus assembly protein PilO